MYLIVSSNCFLFSLNYPVGYPCRIRRIPAGDEQLSPPAGAADAGIVLQRAGVGGPAEHRQVGAHPERVPVEPKEPCQRVGDGRRGAQPLQCAEADGQAVLQSVREPQEDLHAAEEESRAPCAPQLAVHVPLQGDRGAARRVLGIEWQASGAHNQNHNELSYYQRRRQAAELGVLLNKDNLTPHQHSLLQSLSQSQSQSHSHAHSTDSSQSGASWTASCPITLWRRSSARWLARSVAPHPVYPACPPAASTRILQMQMVQAAAAAAAVAAHKRHELQMASVGGVQMTPEDDDEDEPQRPAFKTTFMSWVMATASDWATRQWTTLAKHPTSKRTAMEHSTCTTRTTITTRTTYQ